jgi:predicted dehydrogenase
MRNRVADMKIKSNPSRRSFLKSSAAAALTAGFPAIIPGSALGKDGTVAPSNRITLATIGTGNQGIGELRKFLTDKRCQYVAVCDVNKESNGYWSNKPGGREVAKRICTDFYQRNQPAGNYRGIHAYADFRDVLQRSDIDAVHIATPDHWHALPVIEAAKAKKHIYGQKPLSLTIAEGRAMSNAVKRAGVTFQTGSQQRSDNRFQYAAELIRSGAIGTVAKTTCYLPAGNRDYSGQGHLKNPAPIPEAFDYDMWLGPAPWAEYAPARCHVNFRWIYDYSGGQITDWGGHHPDIAQLALGTQLTGPVAIRNARGVLPPRDALWNTPESYYFEAHYADGRVMVIQSSDKQNGIRFEGSDGWLFVGRHGIEASDPGLLKKDRIGNDWKNAIQKHFANFLDCIDSGKETAAPCEQAHRSITISHLGNIALLTGRDLHWDPDREQIPNDVAANSMIDRPYRSPWKLPQI